MTTPQKLSARQRKINEREAQIEDQEKELAKREAAIEERKKLFSTFVPYNDLEKYTVNEERALYDMRGLTTEAFKKLARNCQRELSSKALMLDGIARDKPLWMSRGIQMFIDNIEHKIKHFEGRKDRETVKHKVKVTREESVEPRSVSYLYQNP